MVTKAKKATYQQLGKKSKKNLDKPFRIRFKPLPLPS